MSSRRAGRGRRQQAEIARRRAARERPHAEERATPRFRILALVALWAVFALPALVSGIFAYSGEVRWGLVAAVLTALAVRLLLRARYGRLHPASNTGLLAAQFAMLFSITLLTPRFALGWHGTPVPATVTGVHYHHTPGRSALSSTTYELSTVDDEQPLGAVSLGTPRHDVGAEVTVLVDPRGRLNPMLAADNRLGWLSSFAAFGAAALAVVCFAIARDVWSREG